MPFELSEHDFRSARRAALIRDPVQIGIDYVEVEPGERRITLHFVPPAEPLRVDKNDRLRAILQALSPENLRLSGGQGTAAANLHIAGLSPTSTDPPALQIQYTLSEAGVGGSSPNYTLELVNVPGLDPFFSRVRFSLRLDQPTEFDPAPPPPPSGAPPAGPQIDYLARDAASFRRLMLDRLSLLLPGWQERNPADLGVALVEVLAYAGDQLSYYQDAVATEAYLGTARRRVSLRRHARLLDYAMHEGCNARAWVQVLVSRDEVALPRGVQFLTRVGPETRLLPDTQAYEEALAAGAQVFESLHPAVLYRAHNNIPLYTWGARQFELPTGATQAALLDEWLDDEHSGRRLDNLRAGDVLIFEQVKSAANGISDEADPSRRHAVRLQRLVRSVDPLGGSLSKNPQVSSQALPILEVEWAAGEALPFPLPISARRGDEIFTGLSIASGNILLVDHGRSLTEELPPVPAQGDYRPRLSRPGLTHQVPYQDTEARRQPAAAALRQDPPAALPALSLVEPDAGLWGEPARWTAQSDLLKSDRFRREFVVEVENQRATLRFGDGINGRRPSPGSCLAASYRVGNGPGGNVGREALAHVVTDQADIMAVRNPLPAQGGTAPESLERARLAAPAALHTQERCVTPEDYASVAARHPEVRAAAAQLRWTGSWHTAFVSVLRRDGRPVDSAFRAELRAFLDRYRLAGFDLEIRPPRFAPLDVALRAVVAPGYFRSSLLQALRETFSNARLPDGRLGFFHPDRFSFGQPVYLSQMVSAAMQVPGVLRVEIQRFQRWGRPDQSEREQGLILIGPLEIARLDNDRLAPENGRMEFILVGGS